LPGFLATRVCFLLYVGDMDRAVRAIVLVCAVEAAFRLASPLVPIDVLAWTLVARVVEAACILATAFGESGIKAASIPFELAVGLGASAAFGCLVLLADAAWLALFGVRPLAALRAGGPATFTPVYLSAACLAGPFTEELFFRGLVYGRLRKVFPAWACVPVTAAAFASLHGGLPLVPFTGGVVFALLFEWRQNVWPGFVVHAAGNAALWLLPLVWP